MLSPLTGKIILAVDDDPVLLRLITSTLTLAGANTFSAPNGETGLQSFQTLSPDMVIIDLMMPGMNGYELCIHIRQISNVPILMLTALDSDAQIVKGLQCGADDYVVKPISPEVLIARIEALLRRIDNQVESPTPLHYDDGYLAVIPEKREVTRCGERISLSDTEYRLLICLITQPNEVVPWQRLLAEVWGLDYLSEKNNGYVRRYISYLRLKIEQSPNEPRYILTKHGVGYMFQPQPAYC